MNRLYKYLTFIFIITGIFFRIFFLNVKPVTYDESAIFRWGEGGIVALIKNIAHFDSHPPFFYILEYPFIKFIDSIYAVRIVSLLSGIIALYLIYLIATKLFSKECGLFSAAFLSLMPFHIYFSRIGRMYSLSIMLLLLITYLMIKLKEKKNKNLSYLLGLVIFLAAFTHYYNIIIIPFIYLIVKPIDDYKLFINIPFLISFWLYLPWIFLSSSSPLSSNFSKRLTGWLKLNGYAAMTGGLKLIDFNLLFFPKPIILPIILIFFSILLYWFKDENLSITFSMIFLLPMLVLTFLSDIFHSIFRKYVVQPNHFILLIPFFILLFTSIICRIKNSDMRKLLSILILFSIFLSALIFEAGQNIRINLNNFAPYLNNKNIAVLNSKVAIELSTNLHPASILLIDKKTLKRKPVIKNNIFLLQTDVKIPFFKDFNSYYIPSNPPLILKIRKNFKKRPFIKTASNFFPFTYEIYSNNKKIFFTPNSEIKLPEFSSSKLKIKIIPPNFWWLLYYIFPSVLILVLYYSIF